MKKAIAATLHDIASFWGARSRLEKATLCVWALLTIAMGLVGAMHVGNFEHGNAFHSWAGVNHQAFCLQAGLDPVRWLLAFSLLMTGVCWLDMIRGIWKKSHNHALEVFNHNPGMVKAFMRTPEVIAPIAVFLIMTASVIAFAGGALVAMKPDYILKVSFLPILIALFYAALGVLYLIFMITDPLLEPLKRIAKKFNQRRSMAETFNELPLSERERLLEQTKSAGLTEIPANMKRAAIADYQARREAAMKEAGDMETATGEALGQARKNNRL